MSGFIDFIPRPCLTGMAAGLPMPCAVSLGSPDRQHTPVEDLAMQREIGRATRGDASDNQALLARRDGRRTLARQLFIVGVGTLAVATVVALFTGMILSLQLGIAFRQLSLEGMVATTMSYAMLREMGPFMTGIILAACVGSAMAAQLGTMTVNDEIAALEMMSVDPVRFLVAPRLWAMTLMAPLLSFYTCVLAFLGGALVGNTQLNIPFLQFIQGVLEAAELKDLYVGLLKAAVFGVLVSGISCAVGFATTQGAAGVGASTRRAVIYSFLAILIGGYFITRCFYVL